MLCLNKNVKTHGNASQQTKNKMKKLTLFLLLTIGFITTQAQQVTNIQPKLVGNNMEIAYEITSANFNQKFDISLFVSFDGGKTFKGPMTLSENDKKEIEGGNHKISWNVFKDVNSLKGDIVFDIRAKVIEEKIKKHYFVQYSAGALVSSINYITPLGFRVGMVGKTGWYVAGYFNTFATTDYNYDGETMDKDIFYEFTDQTLYPRMAVTAGVTFQLGWQSYLYAGAGYATKKYYTQINELNLNGSIDSEHWANNTEQEESGVEVEVGTILNFNKLSISIGLSTFNFKHIGANAGIGIAF